MSLLEAQERLRQQHLEWFRNHYKEQFGESTLREQEELVSGVEPNHQRPDWDLYYVNMLPQIGMRATCNRGRSGCIITDQEHHIIMTGYVGAPPGMPHCDEVGHKYEWRLDYDPFGATGFDLDDMHRHCIRTTHAESNSIYSAAKKGIALENSILYCTMTPCQRCAEAIVQSGIKRVVTAREYHDTAPAVEYFKQGGVELLTVGGKIEYKA